MLDRIIAHWPLKLLSLALAYSIWFSVIDENRVVQDYSVEVELLTTPTQIVASDVPTTATIRVEGTETAIRRLDPVSLAIALDLQNLTPGTHDLPLTADRLRGLDPAYALRFINPARLTLKLSQRQNKLVPVEATLLGRPAEGHALYSAEVSPTRVRIEGPEEDLAMIELLQTNPIRLDDRRGSFSISVTAAPDSPYVQMVGNSGFQVQVTIDETPVERRFENVPVILAGAPGSFDVSPKLVSMTLSGPPRLFDELGPEFLRATANGAVLDPTRDEQKLSIRADILGGVDERGLITVRSYSDSEVVVRRLTEATEG